MARLGGAVAALLTGQDVATAEAAATNAVENNFLQGAVVGGVEDSDIDRSILDAFCTKYQVDMVKH